MLPQQQIRAVFDDETIVVYQAYPSEIAAAAVREQTFVPPFKMERMTWIKPSFLWMMYRAGWGEKKGQERILRIRISREGFEWALANSALSHFQPEIHDSQEAWQKDVKCAPVRIQWDPERSLKLERLDYRSIQIGLGVQAVPRYVKGWIVSIEDCTNLAKAIQLAVQRQQWLEVKTLLPSEQPYPLPPEIALKVAAS